jgi:hypothetical protein
MKAALQHIRESLRARNLGKLKEGFERSWVREVQNATDNNANPSANYKILYMALRDLPKEDRLKVYQWTWDCYHPLMSELGKVLRDMDDLGGRL